MEPTKRFSHFQDPEQDLETAIRILESLRAEKKLSLAQKVLAKVKGWLGISSGSHTFRAKSELRKEERLALAQFKRLHHRLPKLLKGTSEEKKLADRALQTIQNYSHKPLEESWPGQLIVSLFRMEEKPQPTLKIELPDPDEEREKHSKIRSIFSHSHIPADISTVEKDLFRMKGISLMKSHGLISIEEIMKLLKEAPISATSPESSTITLQQTLTPFPGETIILKGSFFRSSHSSRPIPIPESFDLSYNSNQTGFPVDPAQHTGWSLPFRLLPNEPHHPELLPHTSSLLQKQRECANSLKPGGRLIEKAKQHLRQNRRLLFVHKEALLPLHRNLALYLLPDQETLVHRHFDELSHRDDAIQQLAGAYRRINEVAAILPYSTLYDSWVQHSHHELFSIHSEKRLFAAEKILERETQRGLPQLESEFERAAAEALAPSFHRIMLHNLSEWIEYPIPLLTPFEKRLQSIAFHQLESYLSAFDSPPTENAIVSLVKRDLALLQDELPLHPSTVELDSYFLDSITPH